MFLTQHKSRWLALPVILTAPLLYVIDIFIINMAIPAIKLSLHASQAQIQLVIAGYLLGSACFLITAGRAGDYLGRKKVFFWGMFFFTVTSCLCGMAETALQLNIARFFQGISSAFMITQSIAFIQTLFPIAAERSKAIGWYGITLSIAAIIGQILGGYLVDTHFFVEGRRLIFFINVPVGVAALWAIHTYLDETPKEKGIRFDYSGAVILTLGLGGLIYSLTTGREHHWPLWSRLLLVLSIAVLLCFFFNQKIKLKKRKAPLMDVSLFKNKEFNIGLLAVLFHFMMHTAYLLMGAVYLQDSLGISALACGMYFVPHAMLFMIASFIASKLLVRFGKYILLSGLLIILISFICQLFWFDTHTSPYIAMLFIGLYGLGNGLILPFLLNIVLDKLPVRYAGVSSGIFSTFQQTASALGISIIGGIFYGSIQNPVPAQFKEGLQNGLLAGIACLFIVAVMLFILPDTEKNEPTVAVLNEREMV